MKIYQRTKEPEKGKGVHRFVVWMWREMNRQRVSQEDVSVRAGIDSSTMRKWRRGESTPKLIGMEAVINVLGGKLVIRVSDDDSDT